MFLPYLNRLNRSAHTDTFLQKGAVIKMKYKAPEVEEEYEEDDITNTSKRKRSDEETPVVQEKSTDETESQPSSKAARAGGEPDEEEDDDEGFLDEEESREGDVDQEELDEEDFDEELSDLGEEESGEIEEVEGKEGTSQENKSRQSPSDEKLKKTIEKYGHGPLEGTAIEEKALTGSPDTILAMLIDAMLKSKPLSHELTDRTLRKLVDVGYHDIQKLGDASWEERAMVLKDGGYNRYREQGSTNLGKLVEFVNQNYRGYPRSFNARAQLH